MENIHNLEKDIKSAKDSLTITTGFHARLIETFIDVTGANNGTVPRGYEHAFQKCVKELYKRYDQYGITVPVYRIKAGYVQDFAIDFVGEQSVVVTTGVADFLELENNQYFLAEDGSPLQLEQDT
jgi:hypothetical protein